MMTMMLDCDRKEFDAWLVQTLLEKRFSFKKEEQGDISQYFSRMTRNAILSHDEGREEYLYGLFIRMARCFKKNYLLHPEHFFAFSEVIDLDRDDEEFEEDFMERMEKMYDRFLKEKGEYEEEKQ